MTEYFRITGENLIDFDRQMVTGTTPVYLLNEAVPSRDMSNPMTRQEIISALPKLPLEVRGHALNRGMSACSFLFSIQAATDPLMEQAMHALIETLRQGQLYIETKGARGTRAVLNYKSDDAVNHSYKTIYYGEVEEEASRDILGARAKHHYLAGVKLTLYMEPYWRPSASVTLGPNEIYNPGFEQDGDASGTADLWTQIGAPVTSMESTIVLQGFYSQQIDTSAATEGVYSTAVAAPAGTATGVGYAWICRPAAGTNITVEIYDSTAVASRGHAHFDTAGWDTATAKDGTNTFYRVEVIVAAGLIPANNHVLRIFSDTNTVTTFYVDKAFLKFATTTVPDEWCDHIRVFNHYDGDAGHQNYFDVTDLKGTDEARLRLRLRLTVIADQDRWADVLVGRRSFWNWPDVNVTRDVHWLEGEDAVTVLNWADAVLARCSGGSCVSNAANATGYVEWVLNAAPAANWTADSFRGRWDVFGVVYTDDVDNTYYRLSYTSFGGIGYYYQPWVRQTEASTWQMIYLGDIDLSQYVQPLITAGDSQIMVEYAKDAADTVKLDCIWLIPKDEPQTRLACAYGEWLISFFDYVQEQTTDFDYVWKEWVTVTPVYTSTPLQLQGGPMTLSPGADQRLYFSAESVDDTPAPDVRLWEAHGAATDLQWEVTIVYLPQYQTPLD